MRAAVSRMYWIARSRSRATWQRHWPPNRPPSPATRRKRWSKKPPRSFSLLESIETLEAERRELCASPTGSGLAAAVAERWRALMELVAGCRTANEINGHIIHVRQHQVRQLIDIVRGGPAITYSPQGKTLAKALRALARA